MHLKAQFVMLQLMRPGEEETAERGPYARSDLS
jgi:hypothetical protein